MKSKNHKFKEKPFQRVGRSYPEDVKRRIVLEINSGRISQRGAERLYCINRRTLDKWITQISLLPLESKVKSSNLMNETSENEQVKLMSKQIKELQKALANAQLKIDGLQTLIEVSEQKTCAKDVHKPNDCAYSGKRNSSTTTTVRHSQTHAFA